MSNSNFIVIWCSKSFAIIMKLKATAKREHYRHWYRGFVARSERVRFRDAKVILSARFHEWKFFLVRQNFLLYTAIVHRYVFDYVSSVK
jgi:hypothetical protein